ELGISLLRTLEHQSVNWVRLRALDVVHDQDSLEKRLLSDAENLVELFLVRNSDGPHSRITQETRRLAVRQRGIDRNQECANREASKVGDRPLWTVLAQNRDPVALPNPPTFERTRHSDHVPIKFVGRDGHPLDSFAMHHHARSPAVCERQEYVVERSEAHGVNLSYSPAGNDKGKRGTDSEFSWFNR